jgi:transposase
VSDSAWLAQLGECGLLRGSFVPPPVIARLRDLTRRYRKKLVEDRAKEVQRVQKVLEDAGIKLESVISDVMGSMHLAHIDHLSAGIDRLDAEVDRVVSPFSDQVRRLMTIPGVGQRTAEVVIAEIGTDMGQFPTAAHLASWAGLCPGNHESAGKSKTGRARKGNAALRTALSEAAWAGVRKNDSCLGAQFRRFQRRFGKRAEGKAIFACAHTLVVMVSHVLAEPDVVYQDLGPDWFSRRDDNAAHTRRLVHQLERLGHHVTLTPAA